MTLAVENSNLKLLMSSLLLTVGLGFVSIIIYFLFISKPPCRVFHVSRLDSGAAHDQNNEPG